jgi:Flp pilus assembly protein TadG
MSRLRAGDDGSMAVEMVIVIPVLLLLVALVFAYGRAAQVNGTLQAGVRDAARTASQARDQLDAQTRAEAVVREALGPGATGCQNTLQLDPVTFQLDVPVTVTARCSYPLNDLGLPGAPGSITASATFSSPLDPNRGLNDAP